MARTTPERWEVEWTTDVPVIDGDSFPDEGTENVRAFKSKAAAVRFAKTVIEADYWGCPRVSLMRQTVTDPLDGGPMMRDWDCVETIDVTR